jgi:hypothetical protein
MQLKLVNGFKKANVEYNVPLDKWMTYWDIRKMLTEHLGYEDWGDLPPSDKKHVIGQFPRVQFPEWESITRPEY